MKGSNYYCWDADVALPGNVQGEVRVEHEAGRLVKCNAQFTTYPHQSATKTFTGEHDKIAMYTQTHTFSLNGSSAGPARAAPRGSQVRIGIPRLIPTHNKDKWL